MEVCALKPPKDEPNPAGCCGVAAPRGCCSAGLAPNNDVVPVAPEGLKLKAGVDAVAKEGAAVEALPNAEKAGVVEEFAAAPKPEKLCVAGAPKIEAGFVVAAPLAAGAAGVEKSPALNDGV